MIQFRGNLTGPEGGGGAATGGDVDVAGVAGPAGPGSNGVDSVAGELGGNGRVTLGLAWLAVDRADVALPDGTRRRTAGKHSRFNRAR